MSSPYPPGVTGHREESIYALKQASIWLSRIDSSYTSVNTSEVGGQLDTDRNTLITEHHEEVLDTAIDNYVFNHESKILTLLNSDSLSEQVEILNEIKSYIRDESGEYAPPIPDYDELTELVEQKAIELSTHVDEYKPLAPSP